MYQALQDQGFVVLGVNIREPQEVVGKAARERGYTFPVLFDTTAEVAQRYQVRATPTVYLIDRRGRLVASAVGARPWDSQQGRSVLQELLAVKWPFARRGDLVDMVFCFPLHAECSELLYLLKRTPASLQRLLCRGPAEPTI